jgi:hypothetical protein
MIGFDLNKYVEKTDVFVETGTERGNGVQRALDAGFDRVISVELAHNLYLSTFDRFFNDDRVTLLYGDSMDVLPVICKNLPNYPCMFWLDAHVDNGYTTYKKPCPILDELILLARNNRRNDIIMIDDRRKFAEKGDWGADITEDMIKKKLKEVNSNYTIFYENGIQDDDVIVAEVK